MASYRDLDVWRHAHDLVLAVYRSTKAFPKDELFGLTSQVRRSAFSVPANVAEGNGRGSRKEYLQFLTIARGSLNETAYFVTLAHDLGYISSAEAKSLDEKIATVGRLLGGLIRALKKSPPRRPDEKPQ